jgi:hypothetical protein
VVAMFPVLETVTVGASNQRTAACCLLRRRTRRNYFVPPWQLSRAGWISRPMTWLPPHFRNFALLVLVLLLAVLAVLQLARTLQVESLAIPVIVLQTA